MFELLTTTKLKVVDVVVLSQKNRDPDDNPGVKISVECVVPNYELTHFDGALRGVLFQKKPGMAASPQQSLDGVEPVSDLPHISQIGQRLGWFNWEFEGTGYTLEVDHGAGGKSNLCLADCTIGHFRIHGNEGGSVDLRFDIESTDASEKAFGRLAKLKSTDVDALLSPPEVKQDDIERQAPRLTPAQLRAANTEGKTIEQKAAEVKGAEGMKVDAWPFPTDGRPKAAAPAPAKDATAAVLADVKKNGAGHSANPKPKPAVKSRRAAPIKLANPPVQYRDPKSGQSWTGRGLKPLWLTQALAGGAKLDDFQVKAH